MNIDAIIIGGFLLLTLFVGLYRGRHVKTMEDYAMANRNYSSFVLTATFFATIVGGSSTIGIAGKVFLVGIAFIFVACGSLFDHLITARWIVPHMPEFSGLFTIGDILARCYGRQTKIITGITSLLFCIGVLSAQIGAMALLLQYFFNLSTEVSAISSCGVVILYSTFGGIRAVVATDVIQFIVLLVGIPIVANIGLTLVGGYQGLLMNLPDNHLTLFPVGQHPLKYLLLFALYALPALTLSPPGIQRLLMAKDSKRLSHSLYITAILEIPFALMIGIIGLTALLLYPTIEANNALPHMINTILPVGIKGLAISGILAVIMSTADSFLNTAGIVLVHDIIRPLRKKPLSDIAELRTTQIATFFLGTAAIIGALAFQSIVDIVIACIALWGPTILIPLFVGILGLRSTPRAFFAGFIAGIATFLVWSLFIEEHVGFDCALPSMLANAFFFFIFHDPHAKEVIDRRMRSGYIPTLDQQKMPTFSLKARLMSSWRSLKLRHLLPSPANLNRLAQRRIEQYGAQYRLFGVFALLNYILPYFMWSETNPTNLNLALGIRSIAGTLCILLLAHEYWPQRLKPYLPLYWYGTLFFCLPFAATILLFDNNATTFWLMHMALTILLLVILTDWVVFLLLLCLGSGLGYYAFLLLGGDSRLLDVSSQDLFLAIYMYIFATVIGFVFCRQRDNYRGAYIFNAEERESTIAKFNHQGFQSLQKKLKLLRANKTSVSSKELASFSQTLQQTADYQEHLLREYVHQLGPKDTRQIATAPPKEIVPGHCLKKVIAAYPFVNSRDRERVLFTTDPSVIVMSDQAVLEKVYHHLLAASLWLTQRHPSSHIEIHERIENNRYQMYWHISGIHLSEKDVSHMFVPLDRVKPKTISLGLSYCQKVMDALQGKLICRSAKSNGIGTTLFFISLPAATPTPIASRTTLHPQETSIALV